MNKKINPIILRVGIKNQWYSKYFEKKPRELGIYIFKDLEIKNFIQLFLKKYNLSLINYKLYLKKNSLHLYIIYDINLIKVKQLLIKKKLKNFFFTKFFLYFFKSYSNYNLKSFKKIKLKIIKNYSNFYKTISQFLLKKSKINKIFRNSLKFRIYFEKKLYNKYTTTYYNNFINNNSILPRIYLLKYYNFIKKMNSYNQRNLINLFTKKILLSLNNFLKNKINIILTIKQLNKTNFKNFSKNKKIVLVNKLLILKKFEKNSYFNSGINLLHNLSRNKMNKAYIISNYINYLILKMKNFKSYSFLFKFIQTNLKLFLIQSKKLLGITILIKGNLGKTLRAFSKILYIGRKISKIKILNNINYNESTCFSKKGTLGIKVWCL